MARYSSPGHPLSSGWWDELKRFLRRRPQPRAEAGEGFGALFVRKREVRQSEISSCYLSSMKHVPHVVDRLKSARPVIVNLEELGDDETRTRALDFISGAAFALDGSYEKIGEYVFLFVPGSVVIVDVD